MKPEIDAEFQSLVPPLLPAELAGLEADIRAHGCHDPLVTWHGILLDGHTRLEICERLGIPYHITEIELADREAAKLWIIQNQLTNRRNLTPFQKAELAYRLEPLIAAQARQRMLRGKADPTQKSAGGRAARLPSLPGYLTTPIPRRNSSLSGDPKR